MKLSKVILRNRQRFESLSDDSRDLKDPVCLFVKTTMNARYHHEAKHSITEEELSQYFKLPAKIIGITGTNGKTTTATLISHILLQNHYQVALLGTRGFFINGERKRPKGLTTPTILELYALLEEAKDCDFFVMEVSSHAIVQNRIAGLKFDAKVLTNISSDHLDFHKTLEEYIQAKNSFFNQSSLEIINADEGNAKITQSTTYAITNQADFYASSLQVTPLIKAKIHSPAEPFSTALGTCGILNSLVGILPASCIKPFRIFYIKEDHGVILRTRRSVFTVCKTMNSTPRLLFLITEIKKMMFSN